MEESNSQFLFKLNEFLDKEIENNPEYTSAVVVLAVEISRDGSPNGTINKVFAPPFAALGMIDYLHGILESLRESVMERLSENQHKVEDLQQIFPDMSELFDKLPGGLGEILSKYDDDIKRLIMTGDEEGLKELKKKMFEEFREMRKRDGKDPDDFDITDFTGGF